MIVDKSVRYTPSRTFSNFHPDNSRPQTKARHDNYDNRWHKRTRAGYEDYTRDRRIYNPHPDRIDESPARSSLVDPLRIL